MGSAKGLKAYIGSKLTMLLILLVGIVVVFIVWAALIGTQFLSKDTILSIIDAMIVTSFLAVGSGCLLVSRNIDLSASKIGAFAGVFFAVGIKHWGMSSVPMSLVLMLLALICCGIFGIINGVLVNEFNFQPFIATLAMAQVVDGVMRTVSVDPVSKVASLVNASNDVSNFIGSQKVGGIPITFFLVLLVFVAYGLMLGKTKFGMQIYLVGGNPQAARLCGINPKKITYILYANSGILAGIAGIILMGRTKQGDIQALFLNQFTGLTAAILGGISFGGGTGSMAGVFVGLVILQTFSKGTAIVRFDPYWTNVLSGMLLLIALTMDYYSARKARKSLS